MIPRGPDLSYICDNLSYVKSFDRVGQAGHFLLGTDGEQSRVCVEFVIK